MSRLSFCSANDFTSRNESSNALMQISASLNDFVSSLRRFFKSISFVFNPSRGSSIAEHKYPFLALISRCLDPLIELSEKME